MHVILYREHLMDYRVQDGRKLLLVSLLAAVLLFTSSVQCRGQEPDRYYHDRLSVLFASVVNSDDDPARRLYSDSIITVVEEYLDSELPFDHRFEGIRYLGQFFSSDSLVKVISWNIAFHDGTNRYSSFFVTRDGVDTKRWLVDSHKGLAGVSSDSVYYQAGWYGALYYDIVRFNNAGKSYYVLLGFDLNGMFTKSKVIDIISFDDEDGLKFGAPFIIVNNMVQHRLIFNYSAGVSMMLRADSDNRRIIFDHLSPSSPRYAGIFQYYGPDSSHDALELRDGFWYLVEDIDLRNSERVTER